VYWENKHVGIRFGQKPQQPWWKLLYQNDIIDFRIRFCGNFHYYLSIGLIYFNVWVIPLET